MEFGPYFWMYNLVNVVGGRNHWWWLWNTQRGLLT
jgi:hypothetical protein